MSSWKTISATDNVPQYYVFTEALQRPDLDDRKYRVIQLDNGLRAILISDPAADKAAACVNVAAGSMQDPGDLQGLAHFCEHMLSKGSISYPEENDFMSFITSNGGSRNAATGGPNMYYWFSIAPSQISGALSRLAAFFHSPLFTTSLTAREIHAVDSESKRNEQNDSRRILLVNKHLSVAGHPYRQFGTGNYESITEAARKLEKVGRLPPGGDGNDGDGGAVGRETRRRLVEWWKSEYCASRMTAAILGRESLDDLADMLVSMFSPIPNRGLDPRPQNPGPIWGPSEMGSILFIKTVEDSYGLTLTFLIPDQQQHYTTKPAQILAHFLGHEGRGSICAYLKKKGWLISLSAGPSSYLRGGYTFRVNARLTNEGYTHYQEVLLTTFNYISLLRSSNLPPYHFSEISTISALNFRFQEKVQPHLWVNYLSAKLLEPYPPEWTLSGGSLNREWDEILVRETLAAIVPERGRVTLQAQEHDERVVGKDAQWESEKWYGTQYSVRRIDASFIDKAQAPNENVELFLPSPNLYIPENLTVERLEISSPAKFPTCIRRTAIFALWYKKDDQFWAPKAELRVDIRSPVAYGTPRQAVLTRLLVDLVEDALSEVTYDADIAGLSYSVGNHRKGIQISVSGFNDKLSVLLRTVLDKLTGLIIDCERLAVFKEQVGREYKNFYLGQPSNLSEAFAARLLMPIVWTPNEKLAELASINVSDVERHKTELLSKVYIEALVNGNLNKEQAIQIVEAVEICLAARALSDSEQPRTRSLILPAGSNFVARETHVNPVEANSSLSYYCQFGELVDVPLRATLGLIVHIIKEPCFSQLRTREQLGYVVGSSMWTVTSSMGLGIKIQSTKASWFVEERVEAFLETFRNTLAGMSAEEFEAQKEGLIVKKLERMKNLYEETARFWGHISSGYYDFVRHETDAAFIRTLKLEDVVEVFDKFVRPSSAITSRKKISVHLVSQQMKDTPRTTDGAKVITNESESLFKAGLACYPAAVPVVSEAFDTNSPIRSML
ncbi:Putative zinc protease [Sparassis crispa]|uniref:Zinc protease n=1 Tax=Sparassis crispa TaxID=139825 RepID=A0A401GSE9_9APHY|nr:Putative zinc protease [Sparassis crispa]GBE85090.1 Putative zinc protease [Sparassis crispa]